MTNDPLTMARTIIQARHLLRELPPAADLAVQQIARKSLDELREMHRKALAMLRSAKEARV